MHCSVSVVMTTAHKDLDNRKPCESPIGDSCSPLCYPFLGLVLTNPETERTDGIGNCRSIDLLLNVNVIDGLDMDMNNSLVNQCTVINSG